MGNLKVILLSGGSGSRLWPLSNGVRSKQFLKLLKAPDGSAESMCQRVMRQIRESGIEADITIATSSSQKDSIISQIGNGVDIVSEPERRDTFPAIALASAYLSKEKNCSSDEVVVVMPIDPYTELGYFKTISKMAHAVKEGIANILLMGIVPTEPSSKLGYIVPESKSDGGAVKVSCFKEKPQKEIAVKLISEGAMWNGGVFAFKLGYLENIIRNYTNLDSFDGVRSRYSDFPKKSFDYEILEREKSIAVIPFEGEWKDLGTWNALSEEITEKSIGCTVLADSKNSNVINELDIPVVCLGIDNAIIAASPDGILISDKSASPNLKSYVEKVKVRPMYEERRWGEYKVMGFGSYPDGRKYLTKLLRFNDNSHISYQRHKFRDEVWTFVNGRGILILDDKTIEVKAGDIAVIKAGKKHAIKSVSGLEIIEVQTGTELTEEDIERFDFEW